MSKITIAVTGSTGGVGGRVATRLADAGVGQRLIVRDRSRAPELPDSEIVVADYEDTDAMVRACRGISTLLFVSGSEIEGRMARHRSAIDAFAAAGVKRVVYTSFLNASPVATFTFARHHFETEEYLGQSGLDFVPLRDGMYMDYLPLMAANGTIRGPAGDGRFAPVSRDDIADVAVAALTDSSVSGPIDITGPELVTMADVARLISEIGGKPVDFVNESVDEAYESRKQYDPSPVELEGWVTNYLAIAAGELAVVSDAVERYAGHAATSLREYLEEAL
ncbi:MAG: SDR family oxidoreductase [Spirochaetota bacterium]